MTPKIDNAVIAWAAENGSPFPNFAARAYAPKVIASVIPMLQLAKRVSKGISSRPELLTDTVQVDIDHAVMFTGFDLFISFLRNEAAESF